MPGLGRDSLAHGDVRSTQPQSSASCSVFFCKLDHFVRPSFNFDMYIVFLPSSTIFWLTVFPTRACDYLPLALTHPVTLLCRNNLQPRGCNWSNKALCLKTWPQWATRFDSELTRYSKAHHPDNPVKEESRNRYPNVR